MIESLRYFRFFISLKEQALGITSQYSRGKHAKLRIMLLVYKQNNVKIIILFFRHGAVDQIILNKRKNPSFTVIFP